MSLSSILQHVKKKGQVAPKQQQAPVSSSQNVSSSKASAPSAQRPVDPVVARLKEKRRLEREQKEQEAREKKGLPPKKPKAKPAAPKPKQAPSKAPSRTVQQEPPAPQRQKPAGGQKKMSFSDLMKRASKVDQSKLSISFQSKNKSPEAASAKSSRPTSRASSVPPEPRKAREPASSRPRPQAAARPVQRAKSVPSEPRQPKEARAPLPIRGPSAKLESKLKSSTKKPDSRRFQRNNDVEDDYASENSMDSFIESDDEEEFRRQKSAADYDRDEIWAIFNKGKKRSYYNDDYDSDDMEATGAEIFEEEMRSKRNAELEDRREAEEEKRLADLKRKKLRR